VRAPFQQGGSVSLPVHVERCQIHCRWRLNRRHERRGIIGRVRIASRRTDRRRIAR
jgi:hypothetical protein